MEAKYCDAFRTYLMVVAEIFVDMLAHSHWHSHWRYDDECLSRSSVGLQERACFGLAALVMQCEHYSRLCVRGRRGLISFDLCHGRRHKNN